MKEEWLQLLIVAVPFCAVALLWNRLPNWVPIHWNAYGQVDDYARKSFGTLFLPFLNLGIALLLGLIPLIDPKLCKYDPEMRASLWRTVRILRLAITGFNALLALMLLAVALKVFRNQSHFATATYIGLALLYIVLGNFMSKLRPNYFLGIRTPWTLESKEVWIRTHRIGGPLMIVAGIVMLVMCLVVPLEKYFFWVLLPVTAVLLVFSLSYSYWEFRKQRLAHSGSS